MKAFYSILFCLVSTFGVMAQTLQLDCKKAKLKANRNKVFTYQKYQRLEMYTSAGEFSLKRVVRANSLSKDTVFVYRNEVLEHQFATNYANILGATRIEYFEKGILYSDSVADRGEAFDGNGKVYFNGFLVANNRYSTTDLNANTTMYFDKRGNDSLWLENGKDGSIKLKKWFQDGWVSKQQKWNAAGRMIYDKSDAFEKSWDDDGALLQHSFDTVIQQKPLQCHKTFFKSGVLSSITYTRFDVPCLTWKYYNEKGKLVKTIQKASLDKTPYGEVRNMPVSEFPFYHIVVQSEDCNKVLNIDLHQKLAALLCSTDVVLDGSYQMTAYLDETGKFVFIDVEGQNASAISKSLMDIVDHLPAAQPHKVMGKGMTLKILINLEIVKVNSKKDR